MLLKLVLAPLLVVGSTMAGRRWGERVTGTLVALPIVAGPILLITCLEHGVRFGARAAEASLLGLVSLAVFAVVFAYAAGFLSWLPALLVSWAATLAADAVLALRPVGAVAGLLVVLAVVWVAHRLVARAGGTTKEQSSVVAPWWDLPGRALATAALVLSVTGVAAAVGPVVTGILAPFPIATSVVAAFALAQRGPAAAVRTLSGVTRGLAGFAVFCFLVAVLLEPVGVPAAFGIAAAVTLAGQVVWTVGQGQSRFLVQVSPSRR